MEEQAELGPCGWPYTVVMDGANVRLSGELLWDLLRKANKIGSVEVGDPPQAIRAFETEINGAVVRFAADEVSNNVWIVASNDAELVAAQTATATEMKQ